MTSKLIVNSLAADTGVSTITFADQAKMGNSIFHSTGFTIGDSFLHSTGVNLTNINATGVITATKFVGEVSVGSSITFEDNEKAYFGTGTDFSIYHDGSASYLHEGGTGGLIVKTDTAFQVFNSAGSQPAFTVTPGGGIDLYHNTTKMLETTAIGLTINGDVKIIDNENLRLGTGNDMLLYHTGSHSFIENSTGNLKIQTSTGDLYLKTSGDDVHIRAADNVHIESEDGSEKYALFEKDGAVELYHNNVKKFETTTNGSTLFGAQQNLHGDIKFDNQTNSGMDLRWDESLNRLHFEQDNIKAVFGTGSDLEIYHDGSTNIISGLYHPIELRHQSEVHIKCVDDGAVELYHNNNKRLESTNAGVEVTGNLKFTASGNGIDFSVGAAGASQSNVLDEYEEGSWTPALTDASSGGGAYVNPPSNMNARYIKIGRLVHLHFGVHAIGGTAAVANFNTSNPIYITGLPFPCLAQHSKHFVNMGYMPTVIEKNVFASLSQYNTWMNFQYHGQNTGTGAGDTVKWNMIHISSGAGYGNIAFDLTYETYP